MDRLLASNLCMPGKETISHNHNAPAMFYHENTKKYLLVSLLIIPDNVVGTESTIFHPSFFFLISPYIVVMA